MLFQLSEYMFCPIGDALLYLFSFVFSRNFVESLCSDESEHDSDDVGADDSYHDRKYSDRGI